MSFLQVDGSKYEGQWLNGRKHGVGKYIWPSKAYYDGEWQEGSMQGFGRYRADPTTPETIVPIVFSVCLYIGLIQQLMLFRKTPIWIRLAAIPKLQAQGPVFQ